MYWNDITSSQVDSLQFGGKHVIAACPTPEVSVWRHVTLREWEHFLVGNK